MHLIAIDPSIQSAGVAVLTTDPVTRYEAPHLEYLAHLTCKRPNELTHWMQSVRAMLTGIREVLEPYIDKTSMVVIEMPQVRHDAKGESSALGGDISKLYTMVGALVASFAASRVSSWLISPNGWKGNTPKDIMVRRAQRVLEEHGHDFKRLNNDAAEALMMAMHANNQMRARLLHARPTLLGEPYTRWTGFGATVNAKVLV